MSQRRIDDMRTNRRAGCRRSAVALAVIGLLQACAAVGPDYQPPEVTTPDLWAANISGQLEAGANADLQTWWKVLDDPTLDRLIERARSNNPDIGIAVTRIRESRAQLAMARGERQPAVDAGGSINRAQQSDDGPLQQVAPANGFVPQSLYELSIDAGWELDVFGRVRRTVESAEAGYQASIEDYRDVLVTLLAEVALTYIDVRATQLRIVFADANADIQRDALTLAEDRFHSGVASKLDVAQARSNLVSTQAMVLSLKITLHQALNRLSVLLGENAGNTDFLLGSSARLPDARMVVGVGVPADVLRQRPDIRHAERLLAAQTAQIGVATANLYPSFSLGGFFGLQSRTPGNLLNRSSVTYGLQAPVQWSLLSGGRLKGNIQMQTEKADRLRLSYENTVLRAIEEVDNAINGFILNQQRQQYLQQAATATSEAASLVLVQYNTGVTDFNNVLVTQRDLLSRQDQAVLAQAQVLGDLIALYKALGGGWDRNAAIPDKSG